MSSQRGNDKRVRPPKYKNSSAFRNDLHDNSGRQKLINTLSFNDTCERCTRILQWKVQYRKYKLLSQPKTCTRCKEKTVKLAYRNLCKNCAHAEKVCPKCCNPTGTDAAPASVQFVRTMADLSPELAQIVRILPERRRRTVERLILKGKQNDESGTCAEEFWTEDELADQLDALNRMARDDVQSLSDSSEDLLSESIKKL